MTTNPVPDARFSPGAARLVWATAAMFVFFQMVLQTVPSVMREGLVVDLSLSEAGFGGLSSSFYYPYILLQIPAGIAVARFAGERSQAQQHQRGHGATGRDRVVLQAARARDERLGIVGGVEEAATRSFEVVEDGVGQLTGSHEEAFLEGGLVERE